MSHLFKRRQFLQTSLLASMGMATAGQNFAFPAGALFQPINTVSKRALTPFFLAEDLLRLLQLVEIDKHFRQALRVNRDYFQLGKSWSIKVSELLQLARDSRVMWKNEMEQDRARTQFALICGWIAHRTFEVAFPVDLTVGGPELPDQVLYQDTYVIKMLQNADPHRKPIAEDTSLDGVTVEEVAELFHLIQQRNLIRMHTLRPEFSKIETWLDDLMAFYHQQKADNRHYAQVYCQPDPKKVEKYIRKANFYRDEDPFIRAPRRLQMAQLPDTRRLDEAVPLSNYGRALQEALEKMKVCAGFILGRTSEGPLEEVMTF